MPPEKFPTSSAEHFETADAIGAHLAELGWTKDELGEFVSAIQKMAEVMDGASMELNMAKDGDGDDVAEVTLVGQGEALSSERLSELIATEKDFMKVFTAAAPDFSEGGNKVILRRRKNRAEEIDTIQGE